MARGIFKNIVLILTLKCDQSAELMSRAQDTRLDKAERAAIFFHLRICRFCHRYRKQLKILRETLSRMEQPFPYDKIKSTLLDEEHSRALKERISKKIRENLDSM